MRETLFSLNGLGAIAGFALTVDSEKAKKGEVVLDKGEMRVWFHDEEDMEETKRILREMDSGTS